MAKLQFVYIQGHVADYMRNVHMDDRAGGVITRLWDHPKPEHSTGMLVIGPQPEDLAVDLVLEKARSIRDTELAPIRVEYDSAEDCVWINQDDVMVKVHDTDQAVEIAKRLLLWVKLEQENRNGTN